MTRPRFSIVIPSRNRALELHHTLRTCLGQVVSDPVRNSFEILVSDNDSSDDLKAVVDGLDPSRIRYVRTPNYLPMTRSWEFAVSHAQGEYVGIVCTDDGFVLNAIEDIAQALDASDAPVITYQHAYYYWPSFADEARRRHLLVPRFVFREGMYDAEPLIEESMRTLYYGRLPCFLNSFCRRDVLDEARARAGALFASLCPDIYSGFLLAAVAGRVYVMNRIMGVGGVSGGSTGGNAQLDPLGPATQAYMNDYKDQPLLPGLIGFPFTASAILDSAVRALNALGRRISIEDALNPQSYAEYCYRQAMLYPMPARAQGIAAVRDYIAHQPPARARAMERRLGLKRAQWMLKDRLPAWAVRPLQSAWHRMHGGSGALKAAGSDRTGELLFDDVYEAASHLTRYHRAPAP